MVALKTGIRGYITLTPPHKAAQCNKMKNRLSATQDAQQLIDEYAFKQQHIHSVHLTTFLR